MHPVYELRGVTKSYGSGSTQVDAVREVDLRIEAGEFVAIARALANEPDVLLADEPTGNLDTATGEEIIGVLRELNRSRGQTVVLITHDPEIAAAASRVVRMHDGFLGEGRLELESVGG